MIYFDTDFLINILLKQDAVKHDLAKDIYQKAVDREQFFISQLCILETGFVLRKLGQEAKVIEAMLEALLAYDPVSFGLSEVRRGIVLAKTIGFQNFSDCVHTAIAETHCDELYTFNKADFKRIQRHTRLKITIL